MPQYKAPLRDMRFLLNEVFDYSAHYAQQPNAEDATPDMVDAILEGAATFCEEVLAPLNLSGDQEGCTFNNGEVTTPKGFKEAYAEYVAGGWQGISHPKQYGGQELPMSLNLLKSEMMGTANWSFTMYPGLSLGCMNTIFQFGTEAQKNTYMPPLVSGEWTGTMCLTEPQCGTDLGQVKTKAEPQPDGTYKLTGTKIFISAGEHDMSANIIHIVLARLPDAPKGTRGISLFIVPKFMVNADGSVGARNPVVCGAIEHKMGIRASATAVLNFDGATGFMIAEPNKGLEAMFTFMNTARIGTAVQGLAHAELSYQGSLPYAKERRSMRALSGKKDADHTADALIWHADVRRMLLTQRAVAEGARSMIYHAAKLADNMVAGVAEGNKAKYEEYDDRLGFYTPILKGFITEMGLECANLGMQVFGGHGYIKEHGMEQIARDARISTLYEGTTGIQALDLLGRKVLLQTRGRCIKEFTNDMIAQAKPHLLDGGPIGMMARASFKRAVQWKMMTLRIMLRAAKDRDVVSAACYDYLMYSGFVMMGHFWLKQAIVANEKLAKGGKDSAEFYKAKIQTAEFYFERLLPRADGHKKSMMAPTSSIMQMNNEHFNFV
ncbi:MAG TPA: acyl-CoA dehydrogenase C-terminal domain-containing protein [Aquabacterium sp.]|uniref:acyl-CoA dehydrogenase C-terminal domain-containing protein n=1 Tax=Aquabacterium sp. TaxID=1872578 RepID=UPI002E2F2B27|nr:acyl-CoA dehydrogenase C-terminal domain-containing protein [Aquabacterium sp.]HEX5357366.1 acyl-CoA dehydrogenase C-terminal domain-containing protein [Aquabacterium sp.]